MHINYGTFFKGWRFWLCSSSCLLRLKATVRIFIKEFQFKQIPFASLSLMAQLSCCCFFCRFFFVFCFFWENQFLCACSYYTFNVTSSSFEFKLCLKCDAEVACIHIFCSGLLWCNTTFSATSLKWNVLKQGQSQQWWDGDVSGFTDTDFI